MAITNQVSKQIYTGNGVTVNFAIPFDIVSSGSAEVEVILRDETVPTAITETLQVNPTHYTLTGGTPPINVTMVTAPSSTMKLLVRRSIDLTQPTDYLETSIFPAETHELALDRLAAQIQQINEILTRVPKLSGTTLNAEPEFPIQPEGDVVWGWDADEETVKYFTADELFATLVGLVLLKANNLSDLTSPATALDNLGIDPFRTTTEATIANNSGVAANITGMSIAGASYTSAVLYYEINRTTATDSRIAIGRLFLYRQPHTGNWSLEVGEWYGQDLVIPGGITFSLSQVGADAQVKYTSDNLTGASYVGEIKFSFKYFEV
jgi:hypothetical protein